MTTTGEYRVGIDFNPSGSQQVAELKRAAAELIDAIEDLPDTVEEVKRLKTLAMDIIETGAMWAVKAATKQAQE